LLDGEMVRHMKTGKLNFLIFDALDICGHTNVGMCSLPDRLHAIGSRVVEPFRKGNVDNNSLPFNIMGKIFRPKHLIAQLVALIKPQPNGEHLFDDGKRCHRNDGLIFTPAEEPYKPYSSSKVMKWKYADHLTADFRFQFTSTGHAAFIGGNNKQDEEWAGFDLAHQSDWDRLTLDMATSANPSEAIIECGYVPQSQKWTYVLLRTDKPRPNHKTVVASMLNAVCENISMEELVSRIPMSPSQDDWEKTHPSTLHQNLHSKQPEESPSSIVDLPSTPVESPIQYHLHSVSPSSSLSVSSFMGIRSASSPPEKILD